MTMVNQKNACTRIFRASLVITLACALFTSCVTINVNFPESAVQKAADDYVGDLYKAKKGTTTPSTTPSAKPSATVTSAGWTLIPEAYAIDVRVNTEKALKIRDRLKGRLDDVIKYKTAGVLGESSDGRLVIRKPDPSQKLMVKKFEKLVPDPKKLEKLVAADQADREDLYEEVRSVNNLPKARLIDIKRSFARSFQEHSPAGTWIEDTDGNWAQKQ